MSSYADAEAEAVAEEDAATIWRIFYKKLDTHLYTYFSALKSPVVCISRYLQARYNKYNTIQYNTIVHI